jgi:hypothetical protein
VNPEYGSAGLNSRKFTLLIVVLAVTRFVFEQLMDGKCVARENRKDSVVPLDPKGRLRFIRSCK